MTDKKRLVWIFMYVCRDTIDQDILL